MGIFKRLLSIGLLSAFALSAVAEVPFNGLILDREMKPKKGVKVYVKDPKRYATTDKKGRFGLTDVLPDDTLHLVISKKETITVPVEGRKAMRIVLAGEKGFKAEDDEGMANTGYGFVKRREFTGVSSGISGEKLKATGQKDIMSALQGLVPGLNITNRRGEQSVNIRGVKSFMLSSEPLYIVDGVTVPSLDFISIYDVDHVEVIKDGSIYGSRGANGAIVVTTKKAQPRK
ncbi:MAG: TonB-dependent receptor plug domain-containing protein [Muribaculaceae bacterium]|nr:TonB-dependent receptor plug domain-containing protein [Muribaculaceae bacterium]